MLREQLALGVSLHELRKLSNCVSIGNAESKVPALPAELKKPWSLVTNWLKQIGFEANEE